MPTELLICILTGELPLDGALRSVTRLLPRVDFALKELPTGDAPVQALTAEDADLDLRHVQPARVLGRVMELHSAQELGGCTSAQQVVEALSEVSVQIVQGMWDRLGREGKQNDCHIHSWGSGGTYDADALYYNYFRKGEAFCYGSSPQMDKWLDDARSTMNVEHRKNLYYNAGKYINDQALAVSLWAQHAILGINKRGIYEAPPDEFLRTFEAKLKE